MNPVTRLIHYKFTVRGLSFVVLALVFVASHQRWGIAWQLLFDAAVLLAWDAELDIKERRRARMVQAHLAQEDADRQAGEDEG